MSILFVFVDGLGIGVDDPGINPVCAAVCPTLVGLMQTHGVPIDACLGVPGLPQSATGQTVLLTGQNASRLMGRHIEGFPGPHLREIIQAGNLLSDAVGAGLRTCFANAYYADSLGEIRSRRFKSVTTTAALTCPEVFCTRERLFANDAVCHDLTRACLTPRGYQGAIITPDAAGRHLARIAEQYDFTLFEFFLTDRAGHSGNMEKAVEVLTQLDAFLARVLRDIDLRKTLFVLTSDHGNIEDMSGHQHTCNPVPFIARGAGAEGMREGSASLLDVAPRLRKRFGNQV